jgi:lipoate-protein ligase A
MDYPKTNWRLIQNPPAKGAWNMAVDEAILESVTSGEALPTLRLYAWEPACLSLGKMQAFADIDGAALAQHGWDVVRRPTGGRAILHVDELTYAVIAPNTEPRVSGGVLESYLRLSQALLRALQILGAAPKANEKDAATDPNQPNPVCFEVPSNYEITVNGKKIVGSAQARRFEGVLQHGTLPLHGDLTRVIAALRFKDAPAKERAAQRLLAHATTMEAVLGEAPTWQQAAEATQAAFTEILNLTLVPGELSPQEKERAAALVESKYGNPTWTERI